MAKMSLREWINAAQKAKGLSTTAAKKDAGKYKSISAAKKAGSLYYTDKNEGTFILFTLLFTTCVLVKCQKCVMNGIKETFIVRVVGRI